MGGIGTQDVARMVRTLRRSATGEALSVLSPTVIRLLARGNPVTLSEIASVTGLTLDEVIAGFREIPDAEFDDDGNLIGLGLTIRPTQHSFQVDERELFTWCALDTLMYPSLIGSTVVVASPCRVTGEPIRVEVGMEGVRHAEPSTAMVSIVVPEDSRNLRATFCNEVHFFKSEEVAEDWLAERPGASLVSVREAFELGRSLNDATFGACC